MRGWLVRHRDGVLLAAVLSLAAGLRLHRIGFKSLWYDEAWSVTLALKGFGTAWREVGGQIYPPLYQFLLHFWLGIFGPSEASARSLSALFGVLAVAAIYWLGRRMADRRVALAAALLLAVSPFHVEYSQEARGYSLLVLLSLLSFGSLLRWFETRHWRHAAVHVASTALAFYTHPYALLFPLVQAPIWLFHILERKRPAGSEVGWWELLVLLPLILFAPILPVFLEAISSVSRDFWIPRPGWGDLWQTLRTFAGQGRWAAASLGLTALVGVAAMLAYEGAHRFRAKLYLAWWWLPILAAFAFSCLAFSVFQTKYLIFASIPLYLMAAEGIVKLELRALKFAAIALILASHVQPLLAYYRSPKIEEWRGLAEHLKRKCGKGDLILVYEENQYDDLWRPLSYYGQGDTARVRTIDCVSDVRSARAGGRNLWLIVTHVGEPDSVASIRKRLELRHRIVDSREFPGITLVRYAAKKTGHKR